MRPEWNRLLRLTLLGPPLKLRISNESRTHGYPVTPNVPTRPLFQQQPRPMQPVPPCSLPLLDLYVGMNKTEQKRAIDLEAMKRTGQIAQWWYEKWTFKLADDLRYTPDFIVQKMDGTLEAQEVKGHWREDARLKIKMFVEQFPFPTRAYILLKNGSWDIETFR